MSSRRRVTSRYNIISTARIALPTAAIMATAEETARLAALEEQAGRIVSEKLGAPPASLKVCTRSDVTSPPGHVLSRRPGTVPLSVCRSPHKSAERRLARVRSCGLQVERVRGGITNTLFSAEWGDEKVLVRFFGGEGAQPQQRYADARTSRQRPPPPRGVQTVGLSPSARHPGTPRNDRPGTGEQDFRVALKVQRRAAAPRAVRRRPHRGLAARLVLAPQSMEPIYAILQYRALITSGFGKSASR